jgi:hypothetical protein
MSVVSTVHGCIFAYVKMDLEQNQRVIEGLPAEDFYPQLTRNMFSVTATDPAQPGLYKVQAIPFGASFKFFPDYWDVWLRKFERLLRRLAWDRAELRLRIENEVFDYTWTERGFEGGPREFGEMLPRVRGVVAEMEERLRRDSDDAMLMKSLVQVYDRVGESAKARALYARLLELDPERAARVEWIDA